MILPPTYALETLFVDQDHDWVIDTIAPAPASACPYNGPAADLLLEARGAEFARCSSGSGGPVVPVREGMPPEGTKHPSLGKHEHEPRRLLGTSQRMSVHAVGVMTPDVAAKVNDLVQTAAHQPKLSVRKEWYYPARAP